MTTPLVKSNKSNHTSSLLTLTSELKGNHTSSLITLTSELKGNHTSYLGKWNSYERSKTSLTVLISRNVVLPPSAKLPLRYAILSSISR